MTIPEIKKPTKLAVPLAAGLAWRSDPNHVYQEKYDGQFATQTLGDHLLAGEKMRGGKYGHGASHFIAFDLLTHHGRDLRQEPYHTRLNLLTEVLQHHTMASRAATTPTSIGSSVTLAMTRRDPTGWLAAILEAGGEGLVRKSIHATWHDPMTACKRLQTFHCRVTAFVRGTQSVEIEILGHPGSQPCHVALRAGKCDRVRLGSQIKVEGLNLTPAGKIREPRPCQDTPTSWLIQH